MQIRSSGITDVGLKRDGNEDSFSVEDTMALYIVADGMGGHLAGEVASRIAVEMMNKSFRKWYENQTDQHRLFGYPDTSLSLKGNYLSSSIKLANRVVYEMAKEYEQYHGMGTTVASLHISPEIIIAANAGDSRVYMIRDGTIELLSKDHTIVSEQVELGMMTEEEAATSPLRHVLTRNLGSSEEVEADLFEIQPSGNDRFLLCSDGLTDLVSDEEILEATLQAENPQQLCRRLVDTVLNRGAHDNTTIVSVFLSGMQKPRVNPLKKIGFLFADMLIGMQKIMKRVKP